MDHQSSEAQRLLGQFLDKTRQPLMSGLKDDMECHICYQPFLTGDYPEFAVKLNCGHLVGSVCILKWLKPLSREGRNSCHECRQPVFENWNARDYPDSSGRTGNSIGAQASQAQPRPQNVTGLALGVQMQAARSRVNEFASETDSAGTPIQGAEEGLVSQRERVEQEYTELRRRIGPENTERRRRRWLQFQEGVVQIVESADDATAIAQAPVARVVLHLDGIDEFLRLHSQQPEIVDRIRDTFRRLYLDLVLNFYDTRPLANISIDSILRYEQEILNERHQSELPGWVRRFHTNLWIIRLNRRLGRIPPAPAATSSSGTAAVSEVPRTQDEPRREREADRATPPATTRAEDVSTAEIERIESSLARSNLPPSTSQTPNPIVEGFRTPQTRIVSNTFAGQNTNEPREEPVMADRPLGTSESAGGQAARVDSALRSTISLADRLNGRANVFSASVEMLRGRIRTLEIGLSDMRET